VDTAAVRALLLGADVRLVTLTGAGGSGKTSLAVEAARGVESGFAGGVRFVALGAVTEDQAAARAIAQALGLGQTDDQTLLDAVHDHVRLTITEPTLLVVDNVEQLDGIAALLISLLEGCAVLRLLVTSRRRLRVSGETNYVLAPLAVPSSDDRASLATLARVAAVDLFVRRATAIEPSFALSSENAATIADLCVQLDGLPLALELAAARIRVLSVKELRARMTSRLDVFSAASSDAPTRQHTLRATLDWSHALLTPQEQRFFRRLSVFAGGCTLESAEAICNTRRDLDLDVIDGLGSLVDKSLLTVTTTGEGDRRFGMLNTVRDFATEQLVASGEGDALRDAHAAYCLVMAEEVASTRSPTSFAAWLTLCDNEYDNHRAALAHLVATRKTDWALRLSVALYRYWDHREHLGEGRAWLDAALGLPAGEGRTPTRALALNYAAAFAEHQGDHQVARARQHEALAVSRALGDRRGEAAVLNALAGGKRFYGEFAEAVALGNETLAVCRELGDAPAIAAALSNLADALLGLGRTEEAQGLLDQARTIFAALGDNTSVAWCLNHLGDVAAALRDRHLARERYREAAQMFERAGNRWGLARTACDLGHLACGEGDAAGAATHFADALMTFDQLAHRRGVVSALEGFARLAAEQGDLARALTLAGAADALRRTTGAVARLHEKAALQPLHHTTALTHPTAETCQWRRAGEQMTYEEAVEFALMTPASAQSANHSSQDPRAVAPPRSDPPEGPSAVRGS
jgi:predicted ATPase